jgi:hypothetical protein
MPAIFFCKSSVKNKLPTIENSLISYTLGIIKTEGTLHYENINRLSELVNQGRI